MTNGSETTKASTISTEELRRKLAAGEQFEFWNVLTWEYYSDENIRSSRHVPLDRIGREIAESALPLDTEIIVYCTGPLCMLSSFAYEKLIRLGYTNVRVYEGGLEEWEAAGLPIDRFRRVVIPELWQPISVPV